MSDRKELDFNALVSLENSQQTKKILQINNSEILKFNIFEKNGWELLDYYYKENDTFKVKRNNIRTYSIGHNSEEKEFIRQIFNRLDPLIDLDFEEMETNNGSHIDIYSINYSSTFEKNAVGQALIQEAVTGVWWDIFWKDIDLDSNLNQNEKNTIIHEIGHSLGLSHPYNDPTNNTWDSSDTVMSYNKGEDDWNTWFSDPDIKALQSIWGRENDSGTIIIDDSSNTYQYRKTTDNKYFLCTNIGDENITNINHIQYNDKSIEVQNDIINVFNRVEGIDDITGKIYRLYNAVFNRFPDYDGLNYWISMNKENKNSYEQTAYSFLNSQEFKQEYGEQTESKDFVALLYNNVLNRSPDEAGYEYWINQLELGFEDKAHLIMGFSESKENKLNFTFETGMEI